MGGECIRTDHVSHATVFEVLRERHKEIENVSHAMEFRFSRRGQGNRKGVKCNGGLVLKKSARR